MLILTFLLVFFFSPESHIRSKLIIINSSSSSSSSSGGGGGGDGNSDISDYYYCSRDITLTWHYCCYSHLYFLFCRSVMFLVLSPGVCIESSSRPVLFWLWLLSPRPVYACGEPSLTPPQTLCVLSHTVLPFQINMSRRRWGDVNLVHLVHLVKSCNLKTCRSVWSEYFRGLSVFQCNPHMKKVYSQVDAFRQIGHSC